VDRLSVHVAETPVRAADSGPLPDQPGHGPAFADSHGHHAGGDAGSHSHGRRGAESADGGRLDVAPGTLAEPDIGTGPHRALAAGGGAGAGARGSFLGLDRVACPPPPAPQGPVGKGFALSSRTPGRHAMDAVSALGSTAAGTDPSTTASTANAFSSL